jgi:hypothetical protein
MDRFLTVAVVMIFATSALATCEDLENSLGVFFDQGTYEENCSEPPPFIPYSLYFVLRHSTLPDLRGMEFAWRFAPELVPPPYIFSAYGICMDQYWDHFEIVMWCGLPIPVTDVMVVASFQMLNISALAAPVYIQAGPTTPSSLPGHATVTGGDPLQTLAINFCDVTIDEDGWTVPGIGALAPAGGCGTVAATGETWGNVKALYH